MGDYTRIVLKSGKDQSLRRYHPWVFSGAVKKIYGTVREGDLVAVEDNKGNLLGHGHYGSGSIAVRMLTFGNEELSPVFWRKRLEHALVVRQALGLAGSSDTNAWRMVFGEGDGLPALIIDHYDGMLVMQFHSVGMYRIRETLVDILKDILGESLKGIYDKSSQTLPAREKQNVPDEWVYGEKLKETVITEYGHRFHVNWTEGQKTGFFIDQRESRKLVGSMAGGRKVLNLFGYTGGFSVYALAGGARQVDTVDSSAKAVRASRTNVTENFGKDAPHRGIVADAFTFLGECDDDYDLMILDPPAFAKHQNVLPNALQGYKRLNEKAFRKIAPGGILATFSCSQAVSRENFRKSVFVAAANAGRKVRILHQLSQPADHPVSIFHPEGEYLKGLILYVE